MGRVWLRARSSCSLSFPVPVCGDGVRAGPGSRLCPALLGWVVGVYFLPFFFLVWLFGVGCWVSLSRALWPLSPHPLSFGLGCWLFFFCVSACFGVPFPGGPLFLAWCFRFWLGGPPVPPWGSCLRCLPGGGFGRLLWCCRAVWWLWAVFAPPPPSPLFFFWGGGLPVRPSAFPGLTHALARIPCGLPGCCWRLRSVWPCFSPMGRVGYVHVGLGAPSYRVRSWLCRLGGCTRRLRVVLGSLRAHLDQVPLNYPSETVVQPSSTAHFHYGFPTVEPLSWYSNKLLSSNLKTVIFQPCKRCHTP